MGDDLIDVRDLIAKYSNEEHARRADEYFHHVDQNSTGFTKPFSSPEIAEDMLPKVHAMLHAAALYRRRTRARFRLAGAGWLSRALAAMGCDSVALDISGKALELAAKVAIERLSDPIASRISYSRFDGRKIDFPDKSFDRVLSYDAFHHVADQGSTLGGNVASASRQRHRRFRRTRARPFESAELARGNARPSSYRKRHSYRGNMEPRQGTRIHPTARCGSFR